ncbi:MAG: hypothetical protein ACRDGQ_11500 [Candidatus Limnocylindrales bacterium]
MLPTPNHVPARRLPSVHEPAAGTSVRRPFRQLSYAEASRALYIDFEGPKDQAPVLLGIHRRGRGPKPFLQQDVLDPAFAGLGCRLMTLRGSISNVVARAEHRDCRIISWSEYDLEVIRTLRADDPALVARFEHRYANALGVAKRWMNRLHRADLPPDGRLAEFLAYIGYEVPPDAPSGRVGETIRIIRPRLERGEKLTARQQQRWIELLEHNRYDCAGMRAVCLRATRELDAESAGAR